MKEFLQNLLCAAAALESGKCMVFNNAKDVTAGAKLLRSPGFSAPLWKH